MPERLSDIFQIDASLLSENNVFNGFLSIDSKFYINPRLLEKTSAEELKSSHQKITNYFDTILDDVSEYIRYPSPRGYESICNRLTFSEIPLAGLGYSTNHNAGKGIGTKLASNLSETVIEIGRLGILRSSNL